MLTSNKEGLILEYAQKPVRHYLQIDGFLPDECDDLITSGRDGYGMVFCESYELRRSDISVRIHILEGTQKKDALALLKKSI